MIKISCLLSVLLAAAAAAVDINVAADEAKKAEATALAPLPGEGYYDSTDLAALALARARRSPSGALWRSFAVPGWGQIYNGKWWKAPFIIAGQGTMLYMAIDNYRTARRYLREAREAHDKPIITPDDDKVAREKWARHDDYVVETEFWGWLFVGVMAYSMMDAYVDAHLADWDVSDLPGDNGTSSRLDVEFDGTTVSLAISLF